MFLKELEDFFLKSSPYIKWAGYCQIALKKAKKIPKRWEQKSRESYRGFRKNIFREILCTRHERRPVFVLK